MNTILLKHTKSLAHFLLALAFILNSSLAISEEPEITSRDIQELCWKYVVPYSDEGCDEFKKKYLWGDKLPIVEKKVNKLAELLRTASLSGKLEDYKKFEKYITFPFKIGIDDDSENESFTRLDTKHYDWIANNIEEFRGYLNNINNRRRYIKENLLEESYSQEYHLSGTITLRAMDYHIYLQIICHPFKEKSNSYFWLPRDRELCNEIDIKIDYVYARFN